jgi:hypothetical protein
VSQLGSNRLTFEVVVALPRNLEQESEWWPMMIWPVITRYSASKIPIRVIGVTFGCVDQMVLLAVFLIQEGRYL